MSSASNTPPEDYFNDLSLPTGNTNGRNKNQRSKSPINGIAGEAGSGGDADTVPKPKRIACIICRKRKLKCDGTKPSCSTCTRLGHSCAYDEVRRKSGPKRGYVKALEERLSEQIRSPYLANGIVFWMELTSYSYRASRDAIKDPRSSGTNRQTFEFFECQWKRSSLSIHTRWRFCGEYTSDRGDQCGEPRALGL